MRTAADDLENSTLRPPMYALIRACLAKDFWTGGEILRRYPGHTDPLIVLADGAAGMLLEACGGDRAAALAIADRWLIAATAERASHAA
jgi:hypothetical protein